MKVVIGSDHAGFDAKNALIEYMKENKIDVIDVGTNSKDSCHYPVYAKLVANAIKDGTADFGVVVCSTGEGIAMTVNKVPGVRCGIGYNENVARLMREHNNAQVISFGANEMDVEDMKKRLKIFLDTPFSNGERHIIRINMMEN